MSIYCWGLSKNGQAGQGDKTGKVILPTKIDVDSRRYGNFIDLSAGGLCTVAITDKNYLLSFGCGKYGRLGVGDEDDHLSPVTYKVKGDELKAVSAGIWHGSLVHANGDLSMWGYNKACGTPGHVLEPTVVENLHDCVGVSCGNNFTLAWTEDGCAYSWGSNHHGVLGHGNTELVSLPKQIEALRGVKVVHMSAGYSHAGAVTDDGKVFMWGEGKFGSLGLGNEIKSNVLVPQMVEGLNDIKELTCNIGENHTHTLALSNNGNVFATGDGYKGKLGLGDQQSYATFQSVSHESFSTHEIAQVSAGGIHSGAISSAGHVFTWGCGSDGRLGHPEAEGHRYLFRSDTPRIVASLSGMKAIRISSARYHTVVLIENE